MQDAEADPAMPSNRFLVAVTVEVISPFDDTDALVPDLQKFIVVQ